MGLKAVCRKRKPADKGQPVPVLEQFYASLLDVLSRSCSMSVAII
jgi:hypothetical protein